MIKSSLRTIALVSSTFIALALTGCSSGNDRTDYALKVVVTPQGEGPSTLCNEKNQSLGGEGSSLDPAFTISIESSNDSGTIYDITINGANGATGEWRYDESMAQSGAILTNTLQDGPRPIAVTITGTYDSIGNCAP